MTSKALSRRQILAAGAASAGLAATAASAQRRTLTAGEVHERMKANLGTPWREGVGVDRFIAGGPDTVVTGVATVMMCSFDALKDSLKAGCNFIITHEPTYWSHQDRLDELRDDPLYKVKLDYITRNNMAVLHLHDHWHAHRPVDGIHVGTAKLLGWTQYMRKDSPRFYDNLPPMTVLDMAKHIQTRMKARTMRVIGDPNMPVRNMYASYGNFGGLGGAQLLENVDVMVIGEAQDWDLPMYVQDSVAAGRKKAFIVIGHVLSEQWGMEYAAEWLRGFVKEIPCRYVPIIEPYWNPSRPVMEINTRI
jgi:putative NIF3 family GTP cyclohydrolase 1 type 2